MFTIPRILPGLLRPTFTLAMASSATTSTRVMARSSRSTIASHININSFLLAHPFSTSSSTLATYNQVRHGCRKAQRARRRVSPALVGRPCLKGICLKVSTMSPKKPNSAERKVARVKLSTDKVITAYIPGEGHNAQQHSVVLVRGGRSQDCPGVKYHLVRGALDLGGVPNRVTSRSKYGTKKPQKAA